MPKTPKKEENIELLKRVIMFMNYDMRKTLNENIESVKGIILEQDEEYKKEFDKKYVIAKTPLKANKQPMVSNASDMAQMAAVNLAAPGAASVVALSDAFSGEESASIIIPRTNQIYFYQEGDNPTQGFFKDWYNTQWEQYIPNEEQFNSKFPPMTLRQFRTPDKKLYSLRIQRDTENKKPNVWNVLGYYDENNQPYIQKDYVTMEIPKAYLPLTSFWDKFVDYWENNWDEWLWVIAAIIVGILTEGVGFALVGEAGASATAMTLFGRALTWRALWRYLGEASVWSTKGLINLAEGKSKDASIDFIFGFLLPAVHGLGINRWGVTATEQEAAALSSKLVGKSTQEVSELLTKSVAQGGLSKGEKRLFKQIAVMAPETVNTQTVSVIRELNNKLIASGQNPISIAEKTGLITKGVFQEIGRYVHKKWYRSLVAYLAHDYFFLKGFDRISEYFGFFDDEFIEFWEEVYNKMDPEEKKDFDKKIEEGLENSETIQELRDYYEKNNFLLDTTDAKAFDTLAIKKGLNMKD